MSNVVSNKLMSVAEAAYMAGFIDGEGTFAIVRQKKLQTRTGRQYRGVFSVANTSIEGLERLREMCGNGAINLKSSPSRTGNHRPLYHLRFTTNQARHILPQLFPYLIVKLQAAALLQQFLGLSADWRWHQRTDAEWEQMERLRVELCGLNHRGIGPKKALDPLPLRKSRLGNNQHQKLKP
jgi:hypothetical protein